MPHKNPNAERFDGPGSSRQDCAHPEKFEKADNGQLPILRQAADLQSFLVEAASGTSIIRMIPTTRVEESLWDQRADALESSAANQQELFHCRDDRNQQHLDRRSGGN
jgi:hypothetical protein